MSTITLSKHSSSQLMISDDQQSIKKRLNPEESNSLLKKKRKRSIDVTSHWKKIQGVDQTNTTKTFECKSKSECKINSILNY